MTSPAITPPARRLGLRWWIAGVSVWALFLVWMIWILIEAHGYDPFDPRFIDNAPLYRIGQTANYRGQQAFFLGWSSPEAGFRWSEGHKDEIAFRLANDADTGRPLLLSLHFVMTAGRQPIRITVNGVFLKKTDAVGAGPVTAIAPAGLFQPGRINAVTLELASAKMPNSQDTRLLAVALDTFSIKPTTP